MPYVKTVPPTGANTADLVRYIDVELEKLRVEHERLDAGLEAVNIIGVIADWFWDDVVLGDPAPGFMRANTGNIQDFTVIVVNYIDLQGRDIVEALKTSTIEVGDKLSLLNQTGNMGGVYDIVAPTILQATNVVILVGNFEGQNGNPQPNDVMELRWEFNTHAPQAVLP